MIDAKEFEDFTPTSALNPDIQLTPLINKNGMAVNMSNLGATVMSARVRDRNGRLADVVMGYDTAGEYEADTTKNPYLGTHGRYSGRIAKGEFSLDGTDYKLATNCGPHHLHGGNKGFGLVRWEIMDETSNSVTYKYRSADGEEGYPGNLIQVVKFTLTDENELAFESWTMSDKKTHANITNHTYWNLSGRQSLDVRKSHYLTTSSTEFQELDETQVPTGRILPTKGTALDFSEPSNLGKHLKQYKARDEIKWSSGGLDNCLFTANRGNNGMQHVSTLESVGNGVVMDVSTDAACQVLYTGQHLNGNVIVNGVPRKPFSAMCIELQSPEDCPNQPELEHYTLRQPFELHHQKAVYGFQRVNHSKEPVGMTR